MNTLPSLRSYGTSIAITGAGLAIFWALGGGEMETPPQFYARAALLLATASVAGILIQLSQAPPKQCRISYDASDEAGTPRDKTSDGGDATRGHGVFADGEEGTEVEKALAAKERFLNQLIEAVPAQVWRTRPEGAADYLNRRWLDYTGLRLEDALGWGWAVVVHPDDLPRLLETWESLLASGQPGEIEARMRRHDGEYRWFLFRGEPIKDAAGSIIQWLGTNTDIDELKKAEEALRRTEQEFRTTLATIPALVVRAMPDGPIDFVSPQWVNAGISEPELRGGRLKLVHPDDLPRTKKVYEWSLATGEPYEVEERIRLANGEYRWYLNRIVPLKDANGNVIKRYAVAVDIHDLKLTEEALKESQRQLHLMIETIPAMAWSTTPEGEVSYINRRFLDFLGLSKRDGDADMSGLAETIRAARHPEDVERVDQTVRAAFEARKAFTLRERFRCADGNYRWIEARAEPMLDAHGNVAQWYGVLFDIDEQYRAEEGVRLRERELQTLIDALPLMAWRMKPDGEPSYINRQLLDYLGWPHDILTNGLTMAKAVAAIIHPDDRAGLSEALAHALRAGEPYEFKCRHLGPDGAYRWVYAKQNPVLDEDGNVIQWYGACIDINELKETEEALRTVERELRTMLDALPALVVSSWPDGTIDFVSPQAGKSLSDGLRRNGRLSIVHPDDLERSTQIFERSLRLGDSYEVEERLNTGDGGYRWFLTRCVALRDGEGNVIKRYATATDIDDLKRTEAALRERERELQGLIDTIPSLVWCINANGEPHYINKRLEHYYGRQIDRTQAVEGSNLLWSLQVLMHPDDLPEVTAKLTHSLKTGEPFVHRYRNRRWDGVYRWVDARAEPFRDDDGRIVKWYGATVDIDDEIKAQEALRWAHQKLARASQLAGLAELSASIAHEVNQPLAAIITNSHACQRWLAADPPNLDRVKPITERLVRDANAAADVIERIRALFRHAAGVKTLIAINDVIDEVCRLVNDEVAANDIVLEMKLDASLPDIAADRVQIQQVLVNLIRNGIDSTKSNELPRSLAVQSRRDDSAIVVEVRDNGAGIAEPERIFEPFFTTKSEGMGMGLAICRSIIEAHAGSLSAKSVEPRGSVFSFTLPIEAAADAA